MPLAELRLATPAGVEQVIVVHRDKDNVASRLGVTFEPQTGGVLVKLGDTILKAGETLTVNLILSKKA